MSRRPMLGVVLAVAGASPRGSSSGPGDACPRPGEQLAGISLLLRAVLSLQKQGADRQVVVIGEADRDALGSVVRDPRVRATIDEVLVDDEARPAAILAALGPRVDAPFLLGRHDLVADPAIYGRLAAVPLPDGVPARLATRDGAPVGALYARPVLLETVGSLEIKALGPLLVEAEPPAEALEIGATYAVPVESAADRRAAVHALFEACRKPVDGLVSRHLNRHVSLFVSRRLVDSRISPNAMTIMTFFVGLAAAAAALPGGYWPTLAGAALMQANSILDGVDGELARVRHQGSKLGQWLDTIGDDSTNLFFYAALTFGARAEAHGAWIVTAGWVVTAATFLAALLYYTELAGSGSGDLYSIEWEFEQGQAPTVGARLLRYGHLLLKQDTFIFLWLCAAVVGYLHETLLVFAAGGVITVIAATLRRASRLFARRRKLLAARSSGPSAE